jgi:acetylornithine/N-succinyldiaminopimelate aminotransferase
VSPEPFVSPEPNGELLDPPAGTRAALLVEALPYIRRFSGSIVVVKYGGNAIASSDDPVNESRESDALASFAEDVVLLRSVGVLPVVVHGGGPQIGELTRRLGMRPEFVDGLRVTDAGTLEIARMVLVGKVNREIVSAINVHGGLAVGLSGEDANLIRAAPHATVGLGFVGDVEVLDTTIVTRLLGDGLIPVVATIGTDASGQAYNINADTVAGALASALHAEKLVFLTDIEGLRTDASDPSTLATNLNVSELDELIASGSIHSGMIPKARACIAAVRGGVRRAHVLDGRTPHALLLELLTDQGVGTMVTLDSTAAPARRPLQGTDRSALMHTYADPPVVFVKGQGSELFDAEGRRYLDFLCGIAVTSLGHAHPEVARAVSEQARTLVHTSNLFATVPGAEVAATLDRLIGDGTRAGGQVFFCNSGSEANECAIKLARKWAGSSRHVIVSTLGSFHGRTYGALSATGQLAKHKGFEPLVPGFEHVAYDDLAALDEACGAEGVAAVILEAIQGEAGVIEPSAGYLAGAREICDRTGILLIVDEVQTGLGRTGRWFGFQSSGIAPDIVTVAKALGNGMPIGACWAKAEVAAAFAPGDHGSTFGGQPLAAAAAAATLHVMQQLDAPTLAQKAGDRLRSELSGLAGIDSVRGQGLLIGLQLTLPVAAVAADEALRRGLVVNACRPDTLRLAPPFIVTDAEIEEAVGILAGVLA